VTPTGGSNGGPRILICHGWSDRNKGDAAIVESLVGLLRRRYPGAEIRLLSEFGPSDRRLHGETFRARQLFDAVHGAVFPILPVEPASEARLRLPTGLAAALHSIRSLLALLPLPRPGLIWTEAERESLRVLGAADVVISKGGGFIFGQPGLRSTLRLWRILFPLALAARARVPFVLYAQTVGPFASGFQKRLARRVLGRAAVTLTREAPSARTLAELGVASGGGDARTAVRVVPDLAFGLGPPETDDAVAQVFERHRIPDGPPLFGVTVREWPGSDSYLRAVAAAIDRMAEEVGAHAVLWPQCTGPGRFEDDRYAARRVLEAVTRPEAVTLIEDELPAWTLRAGYARMDLFLATRFHSAIFAVTGYVPTLAVGYWTHKAEGIFGDLGLGQWALSIGETSPDELSAAVAGLWERRAEIRRYLQERVPAVVEEARRLDPAVAGVIDRRLEYRRREDGRLLSSPT
jgi:colanic acid/amylovoran biosynthesis protein